MLGAHRRPRSFGILRSREVPRTAWPLTTQPSYTRGAFCREYIESGGHAKICDIGAENRGRRPWDLAEYGLRSDKTVTWIRAEKTLAFALTGDPGNTKHAYGKES